MVSALISRVVILVFGTLYPAYSSFKAVKTKNVREYVKWMMYWIVFAFFTCIETFADILIAWLPFYYEMKILFVLWLLSPATKGASILYRKFVHPQLSKREKDIDVYIAKASDQGYKGFMSLGVKGFQLAKEVMVNTAIQGQTKIADHLKKSYSMNDISQDGEGVQVYERSPSVDEDDVDNREIEESYREEMGERGDDNSQVRLRKGQNSNKNRNKGGKRKTKEELQKVEEKEEYEGSEKRVSSRKAYSHKEAYHYGTLPRSSRTKSTRQSVKNVDYQE